MLALEHRVCRVCWQADPEWKDKYCVRRAYDPAHRELDTAGGLTHPASSSDEEVVPMSNSERVTFAGSSGSLSGRLETCRTAAHDVGGIRALLYLWKRQLGCGANLSCPHRQWYRRPTLRLHGVGGLRGRLRRDRIQFQCR